jgi:hypothetical protein
MIASLEDAWRWYVRARRLATIMQRLGARHWNQLPWDGPLGLDEKLKPLNAAEIQTDSAAVVADLDDLCVVLLFSVFEATVRENVLTEIEASLPGELHPAVQQAVELMQEAVEHGSFFKVLEPYKPTDANLVEAVNQVRRYRNWVAHGRRGTQPSAVKPEVAYERLQRFLDWLLNPAVGGSNDARTN